MWWITKLFVSYILGGVTLIPLLLVAAVLYIRTYGSVPVDVATAITPDTFVPEDEEETKKLQAATSTSQSQPTLSGWLTIRRSFPNTATGNTDKPPTRAASADSTSSAMAEAASVELLKSKDGKEPAPVQPNTYSARIMQSYKSIVESRAANASNGGGSSGGTPKEIFYCVLKGSVLFLYHDEQKEEVVAAIGVDRYGVSVESPDGGGSKAKKDAEMFAKRNAIVLTIKGREDKSGIPVLAKGLDLPDDKMSAELQKEVEALPWYLFVKSNTRMEDWYTALLAVSGASPKPTISQIFNVADMQNLVDILDSQADPIPMRWLNAMFGRVFFGLYRTKALEQFIIDRIMKKLVKVPRPGFLSPIVVREVNVGRSAPYFSKPMLKELSADGSASFEVNLHYLSRSTVPNSEIRITIATTATIPTGFKPYVVDLVLAVVIKSFEGNLVLKIKKPPSNRVWYGFTSMPKMDIEIMPVVSERKIQIGMVLKAIEKQIRDAIAESVVLPNMDDIAFFDTTALALRGGIYDEAAKTNPNAPEGHPDISEEGLGPRPASSEKDPLETISTDPTTLRKRKSQKSRSSTTDLKQDASSKEPAPEEAGPGLPRVDTAPSALGSTPGPAGSAAASLMAGKKWLNNKATTANEPETSAVDTRPARLPDVTGAATSASTERSPSARSTDRKAASVAPESISHAPNASSSPSISSTASATSQSTAPSLISTLRTRTADKKALQSSVNEARDAMKKWGVNWAAKRKSGIDPDEKVEAPAAVVRAPDEVHGHNSRRSIDQPSLRERLAAAATAAAVSTSPTRSTEPRAIATPSKAEPVTSSHSSVKSLSISPPAKSLFAPSVSRPTTEVNLAEVSSSASGPSSPASRPPALPVRHQPSGSVGMIVPRVPHRPDSITSISSSPDKTSNFVALDQVLTEDAEDSTPKQAPPLPARTAEEAQPAQSTKADGPPKLPERPETMSRSTSQGPLISFDASPGPPAASTLKLRPSLTPDSRSISTPDVVSAAELRESLQEVAEVQTQASATHAADVLRRVAAADEAAQNKHAIQAVGDTPRRDLAAE